MKNILLLFYIIINVFLYILNFELFNTSTSIDLGFTTITTMPILMVLLIGFVFVGLFYWLDKSNQENSNNEIARFNDKVLLLEKDLEIMSLKHTNQNNEVISISPEVDTNEVI